MKGLGQTDVLKGYWETNMFENFRLIIIINKNFIYSSLLSPKY